MNMRCIILAAIAIIVNVAPVHGHALQPGYMEISPIAGSSYKVYWRVPDVQGQPMAINAVLPANCDPRTGPPPEKDTQAWASTWLADCPGGLENGEIVIEGLERTQTDVLVRVESIDGRIISERLTPDRIRFSPPSNPSAFDVVRSYLPLGVEHILGGVDHLLFVFALLLLVPDRLRLIGAITAFTVAHSITMASATLGWVILPGPPVEAVIALSIMFLASELLQRQKGRQRLSERHPWAVSFSFGLLHGFGFARALLELGLPQGEIPLALLSFNLGVEVGQLGFVAVVFALAWIANRLVPVMTNAIKTPGATAATISAYAIGGVSAYWFLDRLTGFL